LATEPREYELVLMLDPGLEDSARDKLADEVRKRIDSDGNLKHEDSWGMRKLAYEIRQRTEADYRWLRFEASPELLDQLDHSLKIADGVFTVVSADTTPTDEIRLAELTIPGIPNCHSHAFHRALRGRTQAGRGSFWTWREQMYAVARGLEPDTYLALARATYREMALAGITSVGEFHYVHHQGDGIPYTDPNEMSRALLQAATEAGIRITLLDTC